MWSKHTRKKNVLYYETIGWLTLVVNQAQVARFRDVVATLENKVKVTKAEKSNMFWSLNQNLDSTTYFEELATLFEFDLNFF